MSLRFPRRHIAAAGLAGLLGPRHGTAQTAWPVRPVRLIVGFTAGSATDVTARLFAQRFSEAWGQPVVVENVAGNAGAIGVDRVAKSPPDGYTLMWAASAALTILPNLQTLPYDPLADLLPIGIALTMPSLILVNKDLPIGSIADLIAHARANPGKLSYGTPGIGTPQHIIGEMLSRRAGISMEHIPYRGANLTDVISGVVPIGIQNAGAALPMVREGQLRCIAITSLQRSANAPEIPTLVEQGFPGFEVLSWFGLMAPAGTPPAVAEKVHAEAQKVLANPEMRARFATLGLDVVAGSAEQMRAQIAAEIARWGRVLDESGLRPAR